MKKQSLVTKEASNKQHQTQGRPNHTHNPPNNFPQHQTHHVGKVEIARIRPLPHTLGGICYS